MQNKVSKVPFYDDIKCCLFSRPDLDICFKQLSRHALSSSVADSLTKVSVVYLRYFKVFLIHPIPILDSLFALALVDKAKVTVSIYNTESSSLCQ